MLDNLAAYYWSFDVESLRQCESHCDAWRYSVIHRGTLWYTRWPYGHTVQIALTLMVSQMTTTFKSFFIHSKRDFFELNAGLRDLWKPFDWMPLLIRDSAAGGNFFKSLERGFNLKIVFACKTVRVKAKKSFGFFQIKPNLSFEKWRERESSLPMSYIREWLLITFRSSFPFAFHLNRKANTDSFVHQCYFS